MARDDDDDLDRRSRDDAPRRRRPRDDDDDFDGPPPRKKSGGGGVVVLVVIGVVLAVLAVCGVIGVALLLPAVTKVREAANRTQSMNNLKQMAIGIDNYNSVYGNYINNSYDAQGKPLLSWRVHLLPFVEQDALYRQFKLNEPWDSPSNKPLLNQMPKIYLRVGRQEPGVTVTHYRGFSNQGAMFAKPDLNILRGANNMPKGVNIRQIVDRPENTLFIVEANEPVEWTKPDDLDASPGKPFPTLGDGKAPTFLAAFGDGSVRAIRRELNENMLRNGTTIADGNFVNFD